MTRGSRRQAPLRRHAAALCLLAASALPGGLAIGQTAAGRTAGPPPAAADAPADGVKVGPASRASLLASSEEAERSAARQYQQLLREAASRRMLASAEDATLQRLRRIAARIEPFTPRFNPRAQQWKWEVNLLASNRINAFCMPGGKIAFFSGLIGRLNLTDDEIAMVMGHEIAHALREHGRERLGKERLAKVVQIGASLVSQLFGYGDLGGQLAGGGARLALLAYSRDDELEADLVGLDVAARAGYDPRAALVLWDKMAAASKGAPPQWLSTHPSNTSRSAEIRKHLAETLPLYAKAVGIDVRQLPPYATNRPPPR